MTGTEGGLPLALVRGGSVAAMLSAFGVLTFRMAVLPKVVARVPEAAPVACAPALPSRPKVVARVPEAARHAGKLDVLARRSALMAVLLMLGWLAVQTADLAGTGMALRPTMAAAPDVLAGTLFGHLLLAQLVTMAAALAVLRWSPGLALALSGTAVALQAGHGHAFSMDGGAGLLVLSGVVHLAAAGAWLGGLWPLLVVVRDGTPRDGALAARWFSPLGKWCVAGTVLSSAVQFWFLVGGLAGLAGTPYGWVAAAKLALLCVLLGFAAANRYRLVPALLRAAPGTARRRLLWAIAVQTGFGLATVLAAGVLSNLPPSVQEQPA